MRPKLERFGHVLGFDGLAPAKVGNRSRNPPQAVVAARAQSEPLGRSTHQLAAGAIQAAVFREQRRRQFGIRARKRTGVSITLRFARRHH
jgi:hypothetical protein